MSFAAYILYRVSNNSGIRGFLQSMAKGVSKNALFRQVKLSARISASSVISTEWGWSGGITDKIFFFNVNYPLSEASEIAHSAFKKRNKKSLSKKQVFPVKRQKNSKKKTNKVSECPLQENTFLFGIEMSGKL